MAVFVGIIYSAGRKVRRRTCVTDSAASLESFRKTSRDPGELFIQMPEADYQSRNIDEWLAEQVGPRGKDRMVEIENGVVVTVSCGDPAIDRPVRGANNRLRLHDAAEVGDIEVGDVFVRPAKDTEVV